MHRSKNGSFMGFDGVFDFSEVGGRPVARKARGTRERLNFRVRSTGGRDRRGDEWDSIEWASPVTSDVA